MKTLWNIKMWGLLEPATIEGGGTGAGGGGDTPPASPSSSPSSGSDDSLFSDLAMHDDMAPTVPEVDPAPATPVSPPAAVSPPGAEPAAGATPGGPPSPPATPAAPAPMPAAPPGAPTADGNQPPPASGAQPPATPAPEPFDPVKHRDEMVPQLAQQLYALSPEDVEAARTDPGTILPVMAARVHYNVQHAVFSGVMQALPQMMEHFTRQQAVNQENEQQFFAQFPHLKEKPEYAQVVIESIQAVRNATPNLPKEELMRRAGMMATMVLGLQVQPAGATPPATPAAPATPPRPSPASIRPAGMGAQAHITPPIVPGQESPMDDLAGLIEAHLNGEI